MMCGLPVITNIAREIINETECGILVQYNNIKQIKQAIITLRDNPELRTRFGTNGRRAFLEKYNWNTMEKKIVHDLRYFTFAGLTGIDSIIILEIKQEIGSFSRFADIKVGVIRSAYINEIRLR